MFKIGDLVKYDAGSEKGTAVIVSFWSHDGKDWDYPDTVPYPYYLDNGLLVSAKEIKLASKDKGFPVGSMVTSTFGITNTVGTVVGHTTDDYVDVMFPGNDILWFCKPSELTMVKADIPIIPPATPAKKAPIARAVGLYPLTKTILRHMEKRGSISPMEALLTYGCARLAARIHEIRQAGIDVTTDLRTDEAGHRYARYSLAA